MEARAVPSRGPTDTQGLLGKLAKKGRVRKRSTALSSRSSTPAALSCWAGAPGIPGSPGHQPLPGSWRPRDTGTTTAADCIPRPRRRPPPALTRACASRSGPAAPAGSRAPLARGDQAAHGVDEPARAAWLGPPQRSPTGHATGLPMQGAEEWGVGVGGGGRWGSGGCLGTGLAWPPRTAPRAESGFQGAGTARAEPVFAPKGTRHGAKALAPLARAPSQQLPLVPPGQGGRRGPECPPRPAPEPAGPVPTPDSTA